MLPLLACGTANVSSPLTSENTLCAGSQPAAAPGGVSISTVSLNQLPDRGCATVALSADDCETT